MSDDDVGKCCICGNDCNPASQTCGRCPREFSEAMRGGYNEEYTLAIIADHEFILLNDHFDQDEQSKSESY